MGNLTTPQLHTAIQYTLRRTPQVYKNIVKITHVLQPNQRQRFDLWIKTEFAAGLQRLLHLDYKGRLALQTSIEVKSLPAQAIQLTSMLPQYRLTRWKAYRDIPPKQDLYIPKPTGPTHKKPVNLEYQWPSVKNPNAERTYNSSPSRGYSCPRTSTARPSATATH
ncbi:hypothetical protein PPACK8108_LOCUS17549 [Phakopsora pachyrhizi]|uniref:Uncharacterized protein n=1 Tax=Phakopsora pachyrhizi TaxID=170000 RepID=A0AAV0BC31_PHAPC|nr:hypothetical protein PPACK8108_LOCUS17549 [Phakopsora pachyrhizi]